LNRNKQQIVFQNGQFISPDGIIEGQKLLYENGKIKLIAKNIPAAGRRIIDLKGDFLSPGLTELHLHGCGRWGFEDMDMTDFRKATEFLLNRGITSVIPTFQWDKKAVGNAVEIIRAYKNAGGPMSIPGIYIEGPFINPVKKGGISKGAVALPSEKLLAEIIETGGGLIRIMTVAPELSGIKNITELLINNNIIPAFGHSDCRLDEAELLYDFCLSRGAQPGMTHICNASSGLSHREPGLAMLPFTRDTYFELNADSIHVADPMLRLMSRGAPISRILLISDALISAGLTADSNDDKTFYYGKEVIPTERGVRSKDDDILSGSASLIPDVIRHFTVATETPIYKAIGTVTQNASRFLGVIGGKIIQGAETDLTVFNEKLELQELFTGSESP